MHDHDHSPEHVHDDHEEVAHDHKPVAEQAPVDHAPDAHDHDHSSEHAHEDHAEAAHGGHGKHGHGHEHGRVDVHLYSNRMALRAVQISTAGMLLVALVQFSIALIGGSAGIFADALHNFGDVLTTVALWIAFSLSRRRANARFTYGYNRAEDLAGIFIVLIILASSAAAAVESIQKLSSGSIPTQIPWSMAAALIGVVGNEIMAQYKITVGKRINSVSLIADGQHSRIDGLTSLAAFVGLIGAAFGIRSADPIAGLVITIVILTVVYSTSRSVLERVLDAVDPTVVPMIVETAQSVPGVDAITEPRARWTGQRMYVSLNIEVDPTLTIADAHIIAEEVRHRLFHHLEGLADAVIHTDPHSPTGEHHQLTAHHQQ